jgi:hypothetical protein
MQTNLANKREKETLEEHLKEGWQFINRGFPDFLFYKEMPNGKIEAFFVEVKRNIRPNQKKWDKDYGVSLNPDQKIVHYVLKKMGFEVKIVYKDIPK